MNIVEYATDLSLLVPRVKGVLVNYRNRTYVVFFSEKETWCAISKWQREYKSCKLTVSRRGMTDTATLIPGDYIDDATEARFRSLISKTRNVLINTKPAKVSGKDDAEMFIATLMNKMGYGFPLGLLATIPKDIREVRLHIETAKENGAQKVNATYILLDSPTCPVMIFIKPSVG